MRVDLIPQLGLIDDYNLKNKTAVIIDLLRATSTIATAFENGAQKIIPVEFPNRARELGELYGNAILAGEREGLKIRGFTLGNSPLEFNRARIEGKTIIHCTSNGTRTILKSKGAHFVVIGSLLNRAACLEYAVDLGRDIVLICAGRERGPAMEDSICAGAFVKYLRDNHHHCNFSTLAIEAYYLYKTLGNTLHDAIYKSPGGQNLMAMGLKIDIDFCLRKDLFDSVPVYKDGVIIKA